VDVPDIPALYPRGLVQSGPRLYLRLHSRNAANWYASGTERYDYDYGDAELTEWVRELAAAEGRATAALVLFNNCYRAQAAENARRMRDLFARLAPRLEVVAPPAPPPPAQRSLFDGLE